MIRPRISLKALVMGAGLVLGVSAGNAFVADSPAGFFTKPAVAQEHGGGGGGGGNHGAGGGQHKGANPNCPFQDGSGRGGFGPGSAGRKGQGGHGGNHSGGHDSPTHADSSVSSRDLGISGGGGGGENFVCDGPGNWHVNTKVFR